MMAGICLATALFQFFPSFGEADNSPDPVQLTREEMAWIQANPIVTVGIDKDFAPIEHLDEHGEYIGVTADFLKLIESRTGLGFKIEQSYTWEESISLVKAGKIDMLGAAVSSPQRAAFMNFTLPYARLSGVIIVQKNIREPMSLEKLKGMKVTVVHNYIWKDILETDYPDLKLDPVPNIETALKKVSFGMADAMVGYMASASHHSERLGISNLRVSGETIAILGISFAVNKELLPLRSILDKVLTTTTDAQKKNILRKWVSLDFLPPNDFQRFKWALLLLLIAGVVILLGIKVNAQLALKKAYHELEKRVEERTAELSSTNEALKMAKEAADAATHAKSDFLANMSHEIRTPMNGVITASELVMNETLPPKIVRYMEIINTSGHALLGVIDDILDFSKIEAGKLDLEYRPFHLGKLMDLLQELFSHRIAKKQIGFVMDISPDTPLYLVGDSFRLQQILINLVSNAVKFTDEKGKIVVSVQGRETGVDEIQLNFSVEDTGIGIAPEHQDLLFTPFSQVDASTTRKYGGSGLGLCICGQLVEMMGGHIRVQSQPGKGSRFIFTITLERSPVEVTNTNLSSSSSPDIISQYHSFFKGRRLLVVEDNPTNQEITLAVLDLVGIQPRLVDNGMAALAAVKEMPFDAVLMDIQMPQMDGFETTRAIRRIKAHDTLPIIAMTAHTLKGDKEKCMAAGMDGYISKPVSQEKLFKVLKEVIHRHASASQVPSGACDLGRGSANKIYQGTILPSVVPGIDIYPAMERLGADDPTFLRLLETFARNHQPMMAAMKAHWQDQDAVQLAALLHSIKGASSGIGATTLARLAETYEQACQQEKDLLSLNSENLDIFEQEFQRVLKAIEGLLDSRNSLEKSTPASPVDGVRADKVLHRLKQALTQYELKAVETQFDLLESVFDHPVMEEIKEQIASFDYDHALEAVETLIPLLEEQP